MGLLRFFQSAPPVDGVIGLACNLLLILLILLMLQLMARMARLRALSVAQGMLGITCWALISDYVSATWAVIQSVLRQERAA